MQLLHQSLLNGRDFKKKTLRLRKIKKKNADLKKNLFISLFSTRRSIPILIGI